MPGPCPNLASYGYNSIPFGKQKIPFGRRTHVLSDRDHKVRYLEALF
jgi:hypothetical protein